MNDTTIVRHLSTPRMSKIVEAGSMIFLSGQTAFGADEAHTLAQQTREVLRRIDALLALAGSDKQHLASVTIYLKDMDDFEPMNQVWEAWIDPQHAPARCTVQASLGLPELLIELSVIAVKKTN